MLLRVRVGRPPVADARNESSRLHPGGAPAGELSAHIHIADSGFDARPTSFEPPPTYIRTAADI
jgi:hypothetical protein